MFISHSNGVVSGFPVLVWVVSMSCMLSTFTANVAVSPMGTVNRSSTGVVLCMLEATKGISLHYSTCTIKIYGSDS